MGMSCVLSLLKGILVKRQKRHEQYIRNWNIARKCCKLAVKRVISIKQERADEYTSKFSYTEGVSFLFAEYKLYSK